MKKKENNMMQETQAYRDYIMGHYDVNDHCYKLEKKIKSLRCCSAFSLSVVAINYVKVAYYSFQWRKSALFQSCQKCQTGFSFGLLITLTAIRNDFHPKKKYEKLRTC